jgi:cytochrome c oxidase subunit 1
MESNTLEWTAPVEHIHGNWPGELPVVYHMTYSNPIMEDFVPQNVPMKEGEEVLYQQKRPLLCGAFLFLVRC